MEKWRSGTERRVVSERPFNLYSYRSYRNKVSITFILRVILLPPLRDEHCDFAMSSSPEVLNGQSDASTGEEHSQTVTVEDPALSSDHIHKCTYSSCESVSCESHWNTHYLETTWTHCVNHHQLLSIISSITSCLLESVLTLQKCCSSSVFISCLPIQIHKYA